MAAPKSKTSSAAKQRYNAKVYSTIAVRVPKEQAAQFRAACEEDGIAQAQIVKEAIDRYLQTRHENR